jgi:hypothetical protein
MRGQALNYKALGLARWERFMVPLVWLIAAALIGWAVAIGLGIWGDHALSKQAPLQLFAIDRSAAPSAVEARAAAVPVGGALAFFGVADERAYFKSGAQIVSAAEGETLPGGETVKRITKDSVTLLSTSGETTLKLFKPLVAKDASAVGAVNANASAASQGCRLSAADRAAATWINPSVAAALVGEAKTFARMFVVVDRERGGLRAQATGGTTAMFAIADGDVLLRADGQPLKTGEAVATEVLAKLQRGDAVVVEGERGGSARRWVFAPSKCKA